eukprot:3416510-Rhodomonas_salina.4
MAYRARLQGRTRLHVPYCPSAMSGTHVADNSRARRSRQLRHVRYSHTAHTRRAVLLSRRMARARIRIRRFGARVHPEIQYKKPQSQYCLYQECGFLYLISVRMASRWSPRTRRTSTSF